MLGLIANRKARHALKLLSSGDPEARCRALDALGALGPAGLAAVSDRPAVVDALVKAMGDQIQDVRTCAVGAALSLRSSDFAVIRALGERLGDPHDFIRQAAATALGYCAQAAVPQLPALLEAMSREKGISPLKAMWNAWNDIAPRVAASTAGEDMRLLPLFEAAWANTPKGFSGEDKGRALRRMREILMHQAGKTNADYMRFASLATEGYHYGEHEEIMNAFGKRRLSGADEIEALLGWAERDADRWFRTSGHEEQGNLTVRIAVRLIVQQGRGALPVLRELQNKPGNDQVVMAASVKEMIGAAIDELLR